MLEACRARVRRTLALLGKLVEHIDKQGHGEQSRSAAADVLRYFNLAAPLHHQDEEINVFPVLPGRDDAAMTLTVEALKRDHVQMGLWWAQLQQPLQRWSQAGANDLSRTLPGTPWPAFARFTPRTFRQKKGWCSPPPGR